MSNVKSGGTRLENRFCLELENREIKNFQRNDKSLVGCPDIVFASSKIAIFIDSCFWHGCPIHLRMPSSNQDYWRAKINHNVTRDKIVTKQLKQNGWIVIRIWEHSIKNPRSLKWWVSRVKNLVNRG